MRFAGPVLIIAAAIAGLAVDASAQTVKQALPYWRSIGPTRALTRTGPARTYPASWMYQRRGLPLKVVAVFKEWRKVQDPDGTEGWMLSNLLRTTRTAVIRSADAAAMRERPEAGAALAWRAAPGVVGRIDQCGNGWCRFDVDGKDGYVEVGALWGVEPTEVLP